ncbi:MAG: SgcJ/EcaC family oxidoreductase [Gemmatimonadales bacterium]
MNDFSTKMNPSGAGPDDETEILEILNQFGEAFDKRDADLYAANFSVDADWENAFGGRARGRTKIRDFILQVYPLFRNSSQTLTDTRINLVAPGVVVADVVRELTGIVNQEGTPVPDRTVRTTFVLSKETGRWQVVLFRAGDLRRRLEGD